MSVIVSIAFFLFLLLFCGLLVIQQVYIEESLR